MGAKKILMNNVTAGLTEHFAGEELDATNDAALITQLQSGGGVLLPKEIPAIAAAATLAQQLRLRGGGAVNPGAFQDLLEAALSNVVSKQKLNMTLVAGVLAVAAGITVTANTTAIVTLLTPGGTLGAGGVKTALVVGVPGTGSITLQAVDLAGADVATDTSTYQVTLLG